MASSRFLLSFALCSSLATTALAVPFAWIDGSQDVDVKPVHGTIGVPVSSNDPGSRMASVTWRDNQGSLWLFGGDSAWYILGDFSIQGTYRMGDLWKYDVSTGLWIFKHGFATGDGGGHPPPTQYGQLGVEDPANYPAARKNASSWTGNDGYLWMFGGQPKTTGIHNYLSDLWRFNPASNAWTWMGGSSELNDKGSFDENEPKNYPAARTGSMSWKDSTGDLWLFGGFTTHYRQSSQPPPFGGVYFDRTFPNDMWRFDVETSQWNLVHEAELTTISGTLQSDREIGEFGIYGQQGTPSATIWPGGREEAYTWTDAKGNFWMFGGHGAGENALGALNDLWKFEPGTGQWTWVSGSKVPDQAPVYGPAGEESSVAVPGGRYAGVSWIDHQGRLTLFGGEGTLNNDLWIFNPATGHWSAEQFPTLFGNYGTRGEASENNYPGLRSQAMGWNDPDGTLWLFGGDGYGASAEGFLNDLWKTEVPPPASATDWNLFE